jgi:hypothetical protein
MKKFELLPGGKGAHATASTRAGLFTALIQGCFGAGEPLAGQSEDEKLERPFKIEAPDPAALMAMLLTEATREAAANGEIYDDISFTLITDKKAEGAFIGRKGKAPKMCKITGGMEIAKNEEGEWDVTVKLS